MSMSSLVKKIVGVDSFVFENYYVEEDGCEEHIIFRGRVPARFRGRCGVCGMKSSLYDHSPVPRRWRCLDLGHHKAYVEASVVRVSCPLHGVVVQHVPWAHHRSRFVQSFEDRVAWLVTTASRQAVSHLMRIAWSTVGDLCFRVYDRLRRKRPSPLDGLKRLGIDETSYKKGHQYMTVVVDHDTSSAIWCEKGHSEAVLSRFFELLTEEQRAGIELVSADGAKWIRSCIRRYCPQAEFCIDPFHVVSWATDALDAVRRESWRRAREQARHQEPKRQRGRPRQDAPPRPVTAYAQAVKDSRYALLKNPENLTENQMAKIEMIQVNDPVLHHAYCLKETLRCLFKMTRDAAEPELKQWILDADKSGIPAFVELSKKISRHQETILASLQYGLSNARIEAINNKIKLTIRMAYGFRNFSNLQAMVMLRCSAIKVELPWETRKLTHRNCR
jgi:transposase